MTDQREKKQKLEYKPQQNVFCRRPWTRFSPLGRHSISGGTPPTQAFEQLWQERAREVLAYLVTG